MEDQMTMFESGLSYLKFNMDNDLIQHAALKTLISATFTFITTTLRHKFQEAVTVTDLYFGYNLNFYWLPNFSINMYKWEVCEEVDSF